MTKRERKRPVRPIKTKRDYEGATAVVKGMSGQKDRDAAAELRLQSLLRELDKFDADDDADEDSPEDFSHPAFRRRWSDEISESN